MNVYLAQIFLFAGNFAPRNFLFCAGQIISINQNQALFSLLGTTYGGDGVSTFALPDYRGRVMMGAGQGPGRSNYALGQTGGTENVTLNVSQLPQHTHSVDAKFTINANDGRSDATSPNGTVLSQTETALYIAQPDGTTTLATGAKGALTATVTLANTGSNQPVSTLMPYLALNYIICTQGLFPSRN